MAKPLNHSQDHAAIVSGYLRQQLRSLPQAKLDRSIARRRVRPILIDADVLAQLASDFPGEHGQGQFG